MALTQILINFSHALLSSSIPKSYSWKEPIPELKKGIIILFALRWSNFNFHSKEFIYKEIEFFKFHLKRIYTDKKFIRCYTQLVIIRIFLNLFLSQLVFTKRAVMGYFLSEVYRTISKAFGVGVGWGREELLNRPYKYVPAPKGKNLEPCLGWDNWLRKRSDQNISFKLNSQVYLSFSLACY